MPFDAQAFVRRLRSSEWNDALAQELNDLREEDLSALMSLLQQSPATEVTVPVQKTAGPDAPVVPSRSALHSWMRWFIARVMRLA